jgi:L-aspartate oxidase
MREIYDVIIVGTGIAGVTASIYLKKAGMKIALITKNNDVEESNTLYAQGGIIAYRNDDTPKKLADDIYKAGCSYNNKEAVDSLSAEGPKLVLDFLIDEVGIKFSTNSEGDLDYTEEAAHSMRRIIHYKDHTGDKIERSLIEYAKKIGINIFKSHTAIDLITNNHHSKDCQELYKEREVMGLYLLDNKKGIVKTFFSHNVVLATGGIGNLYQYTTNPSSATGDGLSMAFRAGADIINAEFIQFHPTALFHKDIKRFLISESLRGEGAKLVDKNGVQFMHKYSPLKELAPRDVVARAIYEEMNKIGSEYMFLDIANHYTGEKPLTERFSRIYETCLSGGIDITKQAIPIVPAAHYFCGGIKVDISGRTSLKNLFAIGEVSCTGLHGANRLASDSLLEALLWAKKSSQHIIDNFEKIKNERFNNIPDWKMPQNTVAFDPILIYQDWKAIKLTMWNYAGIIRTKKGLDRAQSDLNYYFHRIYKFYKEARLDINIIELRNAVVTAQIIVDAAIHNEISIGCHFIKN